MSASSSYAVERYHGVISMTAEERADVPDVPPAIRSEPGIAACSSSVLTNVVGSSRLVMAITRRRDDAPLMTKVISTVLSK